MSALEANTQRERRTDRPEEEVVVPVNAGSHIYAGAAVMREAASGVAVPAADTAGGVFVGVALEELDNTDGDDGTVSGTSKERAIRVAKNGVFAFEVSGATPKVGQVAYFTNDNTVSVTSTHNVKAGIFVKPAPGGGWYVDTLFAHAAAALGAASALLTDASVAHALNATFSDTEVEAALDALGGKINSIIDCLIAHGLMAAS